MAKSRPQRWSEAAGNLQAAVEKVQEAKSAVDEAISELQSIQEEYGEWRESMPESMESSATAEKLDVIVDLSIEDAGSELESAIDTLEELANEADGADLPRGFGRD